MKTTLNLFLAGLLALSMTSCVVYETHTVTGNPIGTKRGVAKASAFKPNANFTMQAAAKKGKINKIGSVDTRVTVFFVPFYKTVVTGE